MRSTLTIALPLLVVAGSTARAYSGPPGAPGRSRSPDAKSAKPMPRPARRATPTKTSPTPVKGRDRPSDLRGLNNAYQQDPDKYMKEHGLARTQRQKIQDKDPSFGSLHPMSQRLALTGWSAKRDRIDTLQRLADGLGRTLETSRNKPLNQTEFLALDLEATGSSSGRYNHGKKKPGTQTNGKEDFTSGWDEVTQVGYTIYKGPKPVRSGIITIRPDVAMDPAAAKITGLTNAKLKSAPRFEDKAGEILRLMQGRVVIGHDAIRRDWAWLQSNFLRLGVNLPGPRGLVLDTCDLSYTLPGTGPKGQKALNLYNLAKKLDVRQDNHHGPVDDARVSAEAFFEIMRRDARVAGGAPSTLLRAFELQQVSYDKRRGGSKSP